jgi:hypothetical protein
MKKYENSDIFTNWALLYCRQNSEISLLKGQYHDNFQLRFLSNCAHLAQIDMPIFQFFQLFAETFNYFGALQVSMALVKFASPVHLQ